MKAATLDGFQLPFNPNEVNWGYTLNTASYDTLGGRVVQILSAKIDTLNWKAVAGSRRNLLRVYEKVQSIMEKHAETQMPVRLVVPSRQWTFDVYVTSMPAMSFDTKTVSFGYDLTLEIDEDFGSVTQTIMTRELERISATIGYNEDYHNWIGKNTGTVTTMQSLNRSDEARFSNQRGIV